jgi:hypothetical protein
LRRHSTRARAARPTGEAALVPAPRRLKAQKKKLQDLKRTKLEANEKIARLEPFVEKLQIATSNSLSAVSVQQSSYDVLWQLHQGKTATDLSDDAKCNICLEALGSYGPCTSTPCAHLFCKKCILSYADSRGILNADSSDDAIHCPLCRKPFEVKNLIQVDTSVDGGPSAAATGGTVSGSGSGGGSSSAGPSGASSQPKYSPAFTPVECGNLEPSSLGDVSLPQYRQINPRLVAHLENAIQTRAGQSATSRLGVTGAKVQKLLGDLRALGATRKAVVFSSLKSGILHLQSVLSREKIEHVKMLQGDAPS